MKRCDYCGHDVGIDYVSAPDQIGVMHYSKITCAEFLKADVEKLHQESEEDFVKTEEQLTALIAERDAALLQVGDLHDRIYKLGLMCDKVPGLAAGFCPDVGKPRDNLTRIGLAMELLTEKRSRVCGFWSAGVPCPESEPCPTHGILPTNRI